MEGENKNANKIPVDTCLESSLYSSLVRVLGDAHKSDAINYSHKFQKIFLNRLAEDLWNNNPLHPERKDTCICDMPFAALSSDRLRPPQTFSWGTSRQQAAITIQVFSNQVIVWNHYLSEKNYSICIIVMKIIVEKWISSKNL